MEPNPVIKSLQDATKAAAEATIREKQAAPPAKTNGTPHQDPPPKEASLPKDAAPPKETPAAGAPPVDLRAHIKEKYGLDLSEEDLAARLGTPPATNGKAPISEKKRTPPKQEDITDEQLSKFLKDQEKESLYTSFKGIGTKKDVELVKEHHTATIKAQFPDMDDDEIDQLFYERHFLMPEGSTDSNPYSDEEQKLGLHLLKLEADRLRGATTYPIDAARNVLYSQAVQDYNNSMFEESVDEFIKTQPQEITMQFGKSGNMNLGAYPITVKPDTIKEIADIMRTPANLLNKFKAKPTDEAFDLQKMYDFFLKAELFDSVLKTTAADYYGRGIEAIANKLHNNPDLTNYTPAEERKHLTKNDEQKKAEEHNLKQLDQNIARGRKR